eukprot:1921898-Rhodomonas_salina.1
MHANEDNECDSMISVDEAIARLYPSDLHRATKNAVKQTEVQPSIEFEGFFFPSLHADLNSLEQQVWGHDSGIQTLISNFTIGNMEAGPMNSPEIQQRTKSPTNTSNETAVASVIGCKRTELMSQDQQGAPEPRVSTSAPTGETQIEQPGSQQGNTFDESINCPQTTTYAQVAATLNGSPLKKRQ